MESITGLVNAALKGGTDSCASPAYNSPPSWDGRDPFTVWMGDDQTYSLGHVDSLTSFKNTHTRMKQNAQHTAENRHERRYGYSSHTQFPNNAGNRS